MPALREDDSDASSSSGGEPAAQQQPPLPKATPRTKREGGGDDSDAELSSEGAAELPIGVRCALHEVADGAETLAIQDQRLSEASIKALSKRLRSNTTLKSLAIGSIGPHGGLSNASLRLLGDALARNTSLVSLSLWGNRINDEGLACLVEPLSKNQGLQVLDFAENSIGNEGAKSLAAVLRENQRITCLTLWGNRISKNGFASLVRAAKRSRSLTELAAWDNPGFNENSAAVKSIKQALQKNRRDQQRPKGQRKGPVKDDAPEAAPAAQARVKTVTPRSTVVVSASMLDFATEVRSEIYDCMGLLELFRLASCSPMCLGEILHPRRMEPIVRYTSFADLSKIVLTCHQSMMQQDQQRGRRLRARTPLRSTILQDTFSRFVALIQVPCLQPLFTELDIQEAPTEFLVREEFWRAMEELENLESVTFPKIGWPGTAERNQFRSRLKHVLDSLGNARTDRERRQELAESLVKAAQSYTPSEAHSQPTLPRAHGEDLPGSIKTALPPAQSQPPLPRAHADDLPYSIKMALQAPAS